MRTCPRATEHSMKRHVTLERGREVAEMKKRLLQRQRMAECRRRCLRQEEQAVDVANESWLGTRSRQRINSFATIAKVVDHVTTTNEVHVLSRINAPLKYTNIPSL